MPEERTPEFPGFSCRTASACPDSEKGAVQSKFLVAVFDKTGKRVMVQVVYLYDNKLDPEAIDTTVGEVTVAKPKPKPASGALPARF